MYDQLTNEQLVTLFDDKCRLVRNATRRIESGYDYQEGQSAREDAEFIDRLWPEIDTLRCYLGNERRIEVRFTEYGR